MTKTEALHTLAIRIASAKNNNEDYIDCVKVEALDEALEALKGQKVGKWIKTPKAVMGEGYMWYCSECEHQVYQDSSRDYPDEKFCPDCGAKMKKG